MASSRIGLLAWSVLALLAIADAAIAQVRVVHRAKYTGLNGPERSYYDRSRALIVGGGNGIGSSLEWSGPGELAQSRNNGQYLFAVCAAPNRPGVGIGCRFVGFTGIETYLNERGQWSLQASSPPVPPYTFNLRGSLALDESRQRVVAALHSVTFYSVYHDTTAEFDGTTWTQVAAQNPGEFLIYHAAHQRVESVATDGSIYSWDGATWTMRRSALSGVTVRSVCHDRHANLTVVHCDYYGSSVIIEFDANYSYSLFFVSSLPNNDPENFVYHEARRECIATTWASSLASTWAWSTSTHTLTNLSAATVPPTPRNDAMLAVDDSRGAVLFGGRNIGGSSAPTNETWLWNGTTWTNLQPSNPPSPRSAAAMAGQVDRVVLFGGMNSGGQGLSDTWICVGNAWQQVPILTGYVPAARFNHALASDPADAAYSPYLFGGTNGQNWFSDLRRLTWVWNAGYGWTWQWTLLSSGGGPVARDIHAMAVDSRRKKLVVFGGRDEFFRQLGDTWEYDAFSATWTQRTPAHSPSPRGNHGMTFDRHRERTVLVGGVDQDTGKTLGDIWEWDGVDWTKRIPETRGIDATENPAIAYDHRTRRTVIFGGWTANAPSGNTYELVEVAGPAALGQSAPIPLVLTGAPTVRGGNTTPLRVSMASSGGFAWLFVGGGPAQQPWVQVQPPVYCSTQPFYVQSYTNLMGVGSPIEFTVPIPPTFGGNLLSVQGVSWESQNCYNTTTALSVTVQTLQ